MQNLTIAVADFNSLSIMRQQFIWKPPNFRRHGQYNLPTWPDIYRPFHPMNGEYTIFSYVHFSRHTISEAIKNYQWIWKFKGIKYIFSDYIELNLKSTVEVTFKNHQVLLINNTPSNIYVLTKRNCIGNRKIFIWIKTNTKSKWMEKH